MHTTRRQPTNDNAQRCNARRPVEGEKRRGPRPFTNTTDAHEAPHGAQTGAEGVAAPTAPTAPVHPSQSADGLDNATRRGVLRAILATLDGAALVALCAAIVAWCFALERVAIAETSPGVPAWLASPHEAKRIAEGAHRAFVDVLTNTGTLHHATTVLSLLFGTDAREVMRRAHTGHLDGAAMGAALRELREALEALAPPEAVPLMSVPLVCDLLTVAFPHSTEHFAHLGVLEALFSAALDARAP